MPSDKIPAHRVTGSTTVLVSALMQTGPVHAFPAYRPPLGLPAYWGDDVSGVLPALVMAYHAAVLGEGPPLTPAQLALLREYLAYVIHAPCWRGNDTAIARLRRDIGRAQTIAAIDDWIAACLDVGIDPL